mgnify:CR=1 FL=1
MEKEMKQSYLVQRLRDPHPGHEKNLFTFGGGLKNGGLSDEAMDLIKGIFSFDYMGAAEFEFGALPKALNSIADNIKDYTTWSATIKAKSGKSEKKGLVYVISKKDWKPEILRRLKAWAKEFSREYPTKEAVMLNTAITKTYGYGGKEIAEFMLTKGWIELDNGYMFFTDKEMFEKTKKLFGLE